MKKRTRIKKPRDFNIKKSFNACVIIDEFKHIPICLNCNPLTLKQAKRLHIWLGKAIQFLEQEKK